MSKKYIVVACEIMYRELCACAARSEDPVDILFVEQKLHDVGQIKMPLVLQAKIDEIDTSDYEAILLGYGLCNNGTCGLTADIPIVIPRAHDCITLFMGSKEKYRHYFDENPGTLYATSSWLIDIDPNNDPDKMWSKEKYQQYVEEYGQEMADYVQDTLYNYEDHYKKYCFINTDVGDVEANRKSVIEKAKDLTWEFEEVQGDCSLLQHLIDGIWNEDEFIVIEPGNTAAPSYHEDIFKQVSTQLPTQLPKQ